MDSPGTLGPADPPTAPLETAREVLRLARKDKAAAQARLATLSTAEQLATVCEAPVEQRARMLDLLPEPEEIVPLLPDAELTYTVKAVGLDDATWLLAHATERQLATCFDLDAWQGLTPDRAALSQWFAVLAEAGEETALRAVHAIDMETLVLYLREHVEVMLDPKDEDWQPPEGAQTLEGQFYFVARSPVDDLAPILATLHAVFRNDYWLYFRSMQAVMWELESDLEEWALRWREGRLADLGFPAWEESMRIYGYLRPEQRNVLAEVAPGAGRTDEPMAWDLPVWIPDLPALSERDFPIFRAAQRLDAGGRRAFFYAFVSLANKVAVADRMPLGNAASLPKAIEKAADFASIGLESVSAATGVAPTGVVSRASVEHLFRVGANLDPERARPPFETQQGDEADAAEATGEGQPATRT